MKTAENTSTRDRLLEAAGEVFSRAGFREATVREICDLAGANIAAVNYHFGDKERLYAETLKCARASSLERYPLAPDSAPAEERLHAFIRGMVLSMFDGGSPEWHNRLLMRAMLEPTQALDSVVEEVIRPRFDRMRRVVAEITGQESDTPNVKLALMSIVSQCCGLETTRPVWSRLMGKDSYSSADIERFIDHIYRFSLAGLHASNRA